MIRAENAKHQNMLAGHESILGAAGMLIVHALTALNSVTYSAFLAS